MSIPFSGCKTRSKGVISAIAKQLRKLNLKPVSQITVSFDPFDASCESARKFLTHVTTRKVVSTNPIVALKTQILCDRSEPIISINLESGKNITFKSENLTVLEILTLCNKHISSLVPIDPAREELIKEIIQLKRQERYRKIEYVVGNKKRPDLY
ncbi:large ribosomal subunit protein mL53 [Prorops nasuta]|uniref:large ribosomal subunit protein mL53 n=1 Tax=Prorops nasuta TaxID=863751 RepID=UPI0034CE5FDA